MPVDDPLAAAVRRAATDLPTGQLHKLADALGSHDGATAAARHGIVNAVPTAVFRHHAAALCEAWASASPHLSGGAIALAVRAAAGAVGDVRGEAQLSVVWTGPASYEVPVRATGAVLAEVIEAAAETLVVVSFAAYKVAAVIDALRTAADRGVDVRLVLESVVESKGRLSHDARQAFQALGEAVTFYVWPAAMRKVEAGPYGAMHVKCAVADHHTAFVTSANLTGSAMTDNMELGLVVRGGDAPRRIARHFEALMVARVLRVLS